MNARLNSCWAAGWVQVCPLSHHAMPSAISVNLSGLCCWGHWFRKLERDNKLSESNLTHLFHCLLKSFGGAGAQRIRSWWLLFSKYIVLDILWFTDLFESLMNIMSTSPRESYMRTISLAISRSQTTPWIPSYKLWSTVSLLYLFPHCWRYSSWIV